MTETKLSAAGVTAEERARLLAERLGRYSAGWLRLKPQIVVDAMNQQQGIIVSEIRAAVQAEKEREKIPCTWHADDDLIETSCGNAFTFIANGIKDNEFIFCLYCGNKIAAAIRAEPKEEKP